MEEPYWTCDCGVLHPFVSFLRCPQCGWYVVTDWMAADPDPIPRINLFTHSKESE